jgi:hypothetical protein
MMRLLLVVGVAGAVFAVGYPALDSLAMRVQGLAHTEPQTLGAKAARGLVVAGIPAAVGFLVGSRLG